MRNNKTRLAGLAAVAAVLLSGFAFSTGGSAQAVDSPNQEGPEVCYEDVSYVEYQHSRVVTTPAVEEVSHVEYRWDIQTRERIVEEIIQKQTRTLSGGTEGTPSKWWVWSPNKDQGPFDGPPAFPSDPRGTWQGPKINGGPDQNTFGTFNASNGNSGRSSWFHRSEPVPGAAPTWSQWTFWGSPSLVDDGRARGPLPHNNVTPGTNGYREYRYIVIGTQLVGFTEWTTVGQTDWSRSDTRPSDTELRRYVNLQERKVIDVEAVPESTEIFYYTGITGAESSTNIDDATWTPEASIDGWKQFNERTITDQVEVDCPLIEVIPTEPGVIPPTCDAPGSVVFSGDPVGYNWVLQNDGTYVAVIEDGYVFGEDAVTTFDPGNLDQLTGEQCTPPTTEPPTTEPPTTEPPTTEPPVVTAPPTTEPPSITVAPSVPPTAPPPSGDLPATGSNGTNSTLLIALAALLAGGLLLGATRRKVVA